MTVEEAVKLFTANNVPEWYYTVGGLDRRIIGCPLLPHAKQNDDRTGKEKRKNVYRNLLSVA